jgi:hypothetical protein
MSVFAYEESKAAMLQNEAWLTAFCPGGHSDRRVRASTASTSFCIIRGEKAGKPAFLFR